MNIKDGVIENDIVYFFPNAPDNEDEFYNLGLMLPKSGEIGEQGCDI